MAIGDWVEIGGRTWDVVVTAITEEFNILYSDSTGRSIAAGAPLTLDPLGTFFTHKITVKRHKDRVDEFDELFDFISTPRYVGIPVKIVHNQTTISYNAYVSNGSRPIKRIDDKNGIVYWDKMEISIIPVEAQVLPE